jgi:hypothetical protein
MKPLRTAFLAALAALLVSCGGGTGGTGVTSNNPSNAVSIGVMAKGSVIVNGVHFDDNTATIKIDDTPKTAAALQSGMVVKVLGSVNSDNVTGTAQQVKALVEVRGTPTSVDATANPPTLTVLGQVVFADDQTIYSNLPSNFASIVANTTLIEVHGLRDATNRIRATRIEANQAQMGDATVDEIRGVVSGGTGTNPTTFNLGPQAVAVVNGATIVPTGATYQNGSVVEVHCTARPCVVAGVFQASLVEVENADDSAFQPGNGERFEVEGLVSGFTATPGSFFVAGTSVTTTSSTRFEGGVATDLANDVQVEAEGTFNGTTLLATKIEFKRSVIRLQGATANATANSFDMQIANGAFTVRIEVNSQTSGSIPTNGTACVQVRGQRKSPAAPLVVIADEINGGCSNSNRNFIQAPVEAETGTTLTLLGFAIDVGNPTDTPPYEDVNAVGISQSQFFSAVTPANTDANGVSHAGTLVKVTFDNGASTVHQAEIEQD